MMEKYAVMGSIPRRNAKLREVKTVWNGDRIVDRHWVSNESEVALEGPFFCRQEISIRSNFSSSILHLASNFCRMVY